MDLIANRSQRQRCFSLKKKNPTFRRRSGRSLRLLSETSDAVPQKTKASLLQTSSVIARPFTGREDTHTHFYDANSHRRLKKSIAVSSCFFIMADTSQRWRRWRWQRRQRWRGGEEVYVCVGKEMGTVFFRAPIQKLAPLPLR